MIQKAQTTVLAGHAVTIRPIRTSDAAMEATFIRKLSLQTKHYRFFGGVKELSATEIRRLCDADGPEAMALVATVQDAGCEVEIGVCRYAPNSNADVREMALTIADEWQHKGLGKLFMQHLISSAKQYGVRRPHPQPPAHNALQRPRPQQ